MVLIVVCLTLTVSAGALTKRQQSLLEGARKCLGERYDASYYRGGPPPAGRGACSDVLYRALLATGINLQSEVERDIARRPRLYPGGGDRNIDYRRCPNLKVWFARHSETLSCSTRSWEHWQPGDVIFWNLTGDGVADHTGIISDRREADGRPRVIHNFPPRCTEEDVISSWVIVGHFRLAGN